MARCTRASDLWRVMLDCRRQAAALIQRCKDAFRQYRTATLSDIESALIEDILANSRWFALWLTCLFAVAMVALWGHVPTLWLLLFLVLFVIEVAIKITLGQHFASLSAQQRRMPMWRWVFDSGSVYSGLVYGLAALALFHPMPELNRLLLVAVFCALVSNLAAATTFYTTVARTMLPCLMAPLIIVLLFSGHALLLIMALLCTLSLGCIMLLAKRSQSRFQHVAQVNQDNRALLDSLSEQQRITTDQRARAEQAVIDKSRFLAMASHDLRQPLHAIGLLHHALRLKSENAENRQLFDAIDRSTAALNTMFDSLLDVSRLDANVIQPEFDVVGLKGLCSVLTQEFLPMAREKDIGFHCDLVDASLISDANLLARILRNLISNAIKFTDQGEVRLQGTVSNDELIITISDTGPGIPQAERRKVFDEFYQLDDGERFGTVGVGLGLSIVWRLCRLLDIRIHLDASPSGGTRVCLYMHCESLHERIPPDATLNGTKGFTATTDAGQTSIDEASLESTACTPASESAASGCEDPADAVKLDNGSTADELTGLKILLIDDDVVIRQAMSQMLAQWGCLAICEPSVQEAIQRLQAMDIRPDLMICDYQLSATDTGTTWGTGSGPEPEPELGTGTGTGTRTGTGTGTAAAMIPDATTAFGSDAINGSGDEQQASTMDRAVDGIEAIDIICQRYESRIPAILVSGASGSEQLHRLALSSIPCLTKPVAAEALKQSLLRLLADSVPEQTSSGSVSRPVVHSRSQDLPH